MVTLILGGISMLTGGFVFLLECCFKVSSDADDQAIRFYAEECGRNE